MTMLAQLITVKATPVGIRKKSGPPTLCSALTTFRRGTHAAVFVFNILTT